MLPRSNDKSSSRDKVAVCLEPRIHAAAIENALGPVIRPYFQERMEIVGMASVKQDSVSSGLEALYHFFRAFPRGSNRSTLVDPVRRIQFLHVSQITQIPRRMLVLVQAGPGRTIEPSQLLAG